MLPLEIWSMVAADLDLYSLVRLAGTCRDVRDVCREVPIDRAGCVVEDVPWLLLYNVKKLFVNVRKRHDCTVLDDQRIVVFSRNLCDCMASWYVGEMILEQIPEWLPKAPLLNIPYMLSDVQGQLCFADYTRISFVIDRRPDLSNIRCPKIRIKDRLVIDEPIEVPETCRKLICYSNMVGWLRGHCSKLQIVDDGPIELNGFSADVIVRKNSPVISIDMAIRMKLI